MQLPVYNCTAPCTSVRGLVIRQTEVVFLFLHNSVISQVPSDDLTTYYYEGMVLCSLARYYRRSETISKIVRFVLREESY